MGTPSVPGSGVPGPMSHQYVPQNPYVYAAASVPLNTTIDVEGAGPAPGVRSDSLQGGIIQALSPPNVGNVRYEAPDVQFFGGGRARVGNTEHVANNMAGRDMVAAQPAPLHAAAPHQLHQQQLQAACAYSVSSSSEMNRSRSGAALQLGSGAGTEEGVSVIPPQKRVAEATPPAAVGGETGEAPPSAPVKR